MMHMCGNHAAYIVQLYLQRAYLGIGVDAFLFRTFTFLTGISNEIRDRNLVWYSLADGNDA